MKRPWAVCGVGLMLLLGACADEPGVGKDLRTANVELENGAPMAALLALQQRVRNHPDDVPTLVALGRANAALGRYQSAVLFFRDVLTRDPANADAQKGLARIDLIISPAVALRRLEAMRTRFPRDPQVWNDLGIAYDYAGRHKNAQAAYYQAMKLNPLLISAQSNLGLSYAVDRQYEAAMDMLVPLVASVDATPKIRANLAYAQVMSGNERAARATLAHDMSPERADKVLDTYRRFGAFRATP